MSDAQREALERAAAATGPVKIHAGTARILADPYGYLSPEGEGWTITPRGRAYLAGERASERRDAVEQKLSPEDHKWAERVLAWMEAHKRFKDWGYGHKHHAKHVAACDHAGVEAVALGQWAAGAREYVEGSVRSAAGCLKDFDKALVLAGERGVGVSVSYELTRRFQARPVRPRTLLPQGPVVSLSTYRERRPGQGAA